MARVYDEVLQRGTVANTTQSNQRRSIRVAACHESLPRVRATDAARRNVARRNVARHGATWHGATWQRAETAPIVRL
jgi:hypothetical protein